MRFGISMGHHPDVTSRTNKIEYAESAPVVGWVIKLAMESSSLKPYLIGTGSLRKKVAEINKLKLDCVIELHLNSGGGIGGETLYCPNSVKGKEFAKMIHMETSTIMTHDRGIKEGHYLMMKSNPPHYFLNKTNAPALILEHYFLDDRIDRSHFFNVESFYRKYAELIVTGLKAYADSLTSK